MVTGWAVELVWMMRRENILCPSGKQPTFNGPSSPWSIHYARGKGWPFILPSERAHYEAIRVRAMSL